MNVSSTSPAKSPLYRCSRRAAIAFLAFATILAPTFSPTAAAPKPRLSSPWPKSAKPGSETFAPNSSKPS